MHKQDKRSAQHLLCKALGDTVAIATGIANMLNNILLSSHHHTLLLLWPMLLPSKTCVVLLLNHLTNMPDSTVAQTYRDRED